MFFVSVSCIHHPVTGLCCRKTKIVTSAEDIDTNSEGESAKASESPLSSSKRNSKGLFCLRYSDVFMRDLDLASRVPTKVRDDMR